VGSDCECVVNDSWVARLQLQNKGRDEVLPEDEEGGRHFRSRVPNEGRVNILFGMEGEGSDFNCSYKMRAGMIYFLDMGRER
jgi:hypothetical protein